MAEVRGAAELDAFVHRVAALQGVPGISVEVVETDGVLASLCRGRRDLAAGAEVTAGTRFEIGSISKSFVSVVLLSLAAEGRVDLDAYVTEYLPWFDVRSSFAPITLRHLLHHTAGLVAGTDAIPDDRAQAWELRHTDAGSEPGTTFHYSNAGYVVLGLVVEAVTGRTAAELVHERVLAPLGMDSSTAQVTHADREHLATGYQPLHDDRPWLPGDPLIPATWFEVAAADGNVAATVADLGRYLRLLLGRGTLDGATILTEAGFTELTESLAPGGEPSEHPSRYGLGVNMETIDGRSCLTHGGGMVGYASFVLADLDDGFGLAVLTNAPGDSGAAELVARTGYAIMRANRDWRVLPEQPEVDPWVVPDGDRLAGVYVCGDVRIEINATASGGLLLADSHGEGRVGWSGDGRLGCTHAGWRTFHHQPAGEGLARTWTYGGTVLRPEGAALPATAEPPAHWRAHVGHYRSYSPWYTSFRVVLREGALHLVAAGGVEASHDDPLLVELEPGTFRIGADPALPERLVAGPVVDGRTISMTRDRGAYSRTFTP